MDTLLDLEVRALLELVSRRGIGPASGAGAALVTAVAAALVAKAARTSPAWEGSAGAAAQADALRLRAAPMAQADTDAYAAAVKELDEPRDPDPDRRDFRLGRTLEAAAVVPLQVAETAADVALLAAEVADRCKPDLRADAVVAAFLAEAAARSAAHLVEVNLGVVGPSDERVATANAAVEAAARAVGSL